MKFRQRSPFRLCHRIMKATGLFLFLFLAQNASAQLIPFRFNDLWGYCDTSGKPVIQPQYDFCEFFSGNTAFVKKDSFSFGINKNGKQITPALKRYGTFSSGLCPVILSNGECMYIDSNGMNVLLIQKAQAVESFSEDRAVISVNGKIGVIDTKGGMICKPGFDASSIYYRSGFLMVNNGKQYHYLSKNGQILQLADTIQPAGIFSEGLAAVYVHKPSLKTKEVPDPVFLEFIDTSGNIVLSGFEFEGFDYSPYMEPDKEFRDGKAIVKVKNEIGYDYYFLDKRKRFSPLYASARHLGDSLFLGAIGYYMSDIRILDSNYYVAGQFQQKPTQVGEFGNGLLPYRNKDGLWGYVDKNCRDIIPAKYTSAFNFRNGYAWVILNGKPGVINRFGREYFIDKP